MLLHNLRYVPHLHLSVPDRLWVDHNHRTMFALVKTTRFVGSDPMFQSGILDRIFESGFEVLAPFRKTAGARGRRIALVRADK